MSEEVNQKLRSMIVNFIPIGAVINIHVVCGVLAGIVRSNLEKFGQFSDFEVTRSWVSSHYHCMIAATTSRPIITRSLWEDINTQYLHDIASAVRTYNVPNELILNANQTPSKYVPTTNVTMAEQGTAHIPARGREDKRAITVTVIQSLSGKMLPFQIIYTGKSERCLPLEHWSNEVETLSLIDKIIAPYIENLKNELQFPNNKKSLLSGVHLKDNVLQEFKRD